ncbi:STAS domain-containing protein [Streptomyces sp. NPDC054835]
MATGKAQASSPDTGPEPVPYVVRVRGDMDLGHKERLRASFAEALAQAPAGSDIVVDLWNSSFCDSAGLSTLLTARTKALEEGHRLVLASPGHQMIRLLELTRAEDLFRHLPSTADAAPEEGPS